MTRALRAGLGSTLAILVALGSAGTVSAQDASAGQDSAAAGGEDVRSTLEGVYTEAQAERGQQLMWDICAECHFEEDYQGAFFQDWVGATAWGLWESIWSTMPEDNPGGLAAQDYSDAVAYMFKLNGLPPGDEELPTEQSALERIRIEWEAGGGR